MNNFDSELRILLKNEFKDFQLRGDSSVLNIALKKIEKTNLEHQSSGVIYPDLFEIMHLSIKDNEISDNWKSFYQILLEERALTDSQQPFNKHTTEIYWNKNPLETKDDIKNKSSRKDNPYKESI